MDGLGTSAATWAAEAWKASSVRVETSCDVEALCRDLAQRCCTLEVELEAKRREAEEKGTIERQIATIEEQIRVARETRIQAVKAVQGLTRMSVDEVKAMKNRPPRMVRRAIEAVYTVLSYQRWLESVRGFDVTKEWNRIQRMLANDGFVQSVLQFNVAGLDAAPHVVEYLVEKYFPSLPQDIEPIAVCHSSQCSPKMSARGWRPPSSAGEFSAKVQQQFDLSGIDAPLPPITAPLSTTSGDSPRRKFVARARSPVPMDTLSISQAETASADLPLPPISTASTSTGSDSARKKMPTDVRLEIGLSNVVAPGHVLPTVQAQLDVTNMELPLPPITFTGSDAVRRGATARGANDVVVADTSSTAQQIDVSNMDAPLPPITTTLGAGSDSARRAPPSGMRSLTNSIVGQKSQRLGPLTSVSNTKRLEKGKGRKSSSNMEIFQEPLDIAAVEYASRACGAMVRWVYEVLREFVALRTLRIQKSILLTRLGDDYYKKTDEAITQLQEEIRKIQEELESWKKRLVEIKTKEAETEYAKSALAKLSRLEERCGFDKAVLGANALSRTGRGGKLRPVLAMSDTIASSIGKGGPVARNRSMLDLQPHTEKEARNQAQNSDTAWPPKNRKYLHVMSTPTLPTHATGEEVAE